MFLGRRLEALCSLTVSSPVWPSMIFFVLLFVRPFPFITSFSLAKWMKAKSFWTALKKFTQGICFCLFFFLTLWFAPNRILPWALCTSHSSFWVFAFVTSFAQIFSNFCIHSLFPVVSFEDLNSHRELLWSQKIISIQGPCCFFFIRIVCNFMDKMYTQGSYQLTWDI